MYLNVTIEKLISSILPHHLKWSKIRCLESLMNGNVFSRFPHMHKLLFPNLSLPQESLPRKGIQSTTLLENQLF